MVVITRRRPGIPVEYGIAQDEAGMLAWTDVATTLGAALTFWVSTVTPTGEPHLIPIWGAWTGDAGYIEGGDMTRWAKNLANDDRVHVGVDHNDQHVMVRGAAKKTEVDDATKTAIADVYAAKYPYRPEGSTFWRISPLRVLAWNMRSVDDFATTPTEFVFEEES